MPIGLERETARRRNSISIPALNETLMGFVLFVLVAFVLLSVDASVYFAIAEPILLALGASAVAGP